MVKGITRQVILVRSPDPELFEQAIFILKDGAVKTGITDEMLLQQAKSAAARSSVRDWPRLLWGGACAGVGAAAVGAAWAICWLL